MGKTRFWCFSLLRLVGSFSTHPKSLGYFSSIPSASTGRARVSGVELGSLEPSLATTPTKNMILFAKIYKIGNFFTIVHVWEG